MTDGRDEIRYVEESIVAGAAIDAPTVAGRGFLLSRFGWALASFGGSFAVKLGLNVLLARLLAPEIFGIMVVVNSLRIGIELLTDVGIEQNIVRDPRGLEADFLNTAWTMQVARGLVLTLFFIAAAPIAGHFYGLDPRVLALIGLAPFINALHSTAVFVLVRQLEVRRRNLFEFSAELINAAICCLFAWISPTVWSLLAGTLVGIAARSAISHFLPHPPHRLMFRREYVRAIFRFGRWIAAASLLTYLAGNIDRLTLGRLAPLAILGIYGLARTISELPATLAGRLSYQVIFPALASRSGGVIDTLASARLLVVGVAAVGMASVAAWTDWAVWLMYDPRYAQAGPMLFGLLVGAWLGILSTLNEALVLGAGRPVFVSAAGLVRLAVTGVALPLGYLTLGIGGAVAAVIAGEVVRYVTILLGQRRVGQGHGGQDLLATLLFAAVLLGWAALREAMGWGQAWEGLWHGV